ALRHDTDLCAMAASEFSRRDARLHRELLHRIRDPEIAKRGADLRIHIADAIEQEEIRLRARTGDVESAALLTRLRRCSTRRKQSEIKILAGIQGHVANSSRVNYRTDGALVAFEQRRDCLYLNRFGQAADFEREIEVRDLIHLHSDC